ncbi:hypothetical protein FGO68_gene953 [Halteria grandinella]|uniref:glutathione transferase n=1 Tax=Halteria grandinella TaxID=5974 RepID=A0A8J8NJU6_HALGN|nr:hypothetical protein FGO68_gene953 [Halteria grandinella]
MESQSAPSTKPLLGYWHIRGYGAYIKLAFAAVGVDFDYVPYYESDEAKWFQTDKPSLSMTLPNLPYLRDGDLEISEHDAIYRHVFRKYKPELLGKTINDQAQVDQFLTYWVKLNSALRTPCYTQSDPTEDNRKAIIEPFRATLDRLDARLATRKYHMGDDLTAADIYLYETFEVLKLIHESTANGWLNIKRVGESIETLGWFESYKKSQYYAEQINGDEAHINNRK